MAKTITPIKCPNCRGDKFIITHIGNAELQDDVIVEKDTKTALICATGSCGYQISDSTHLHLTDIQIYIVGNSVSGSRQGLVRATTLRGKAMAKLLDELWRDKYVNFGDDKKKWAVTGDMWDAYQQGNARIPFPDGVKFNITR